MDTIILEAIKKGDVGILDLNIFTEEARNILMGQEQGHINAVLGKGNVKNENIDYEEITGDRTTFLEPSINLFNYKKSKLGYYKATTGEWTESTSVKSSEFIKCVKNTKFYWNTSNKPSIVFLDAETNFISGLPSNSWSEYFTSPDDDRVAYVVVTFSVNDANINNLMLTKDSKPSSYISYEEVTTRNIKLEDGIVGFNALSEELRNELASILAFQDKSILFFGDSITETASMDDDGSNYVEGIRTNYPTFLNKRLKFKEMWNYAKSGASYRNRNLEFRQFIGNQIDTAIANNRKADIIIISASTNDGGASFSANLDSYEEAMSKEISQLDKTKLYQSIRYAMYRIRENYPNAICFCSTPLQRADREPIPELSNAVEKMANRYNFIVIDAENESGIIRDFEIWQGEGRYLKDGLHPKTNGQELEADLFESYLKMYC